MAKYVFLLWQDESKAERPGTPGFDTEMGAYGALQQELMAAGAFKGGDPLQPSGAGQVVRVRNGSVDASKGTVATGAEQLVGYYELDCKDDADAARWAAKIPAAAKGAIEVRPVLAM
ncbi:MAG: YciI family protein [Candidatus Dormibacteraeota bacterium]|nr:YciI family protein [Candidatus Dormibacteraeota bacterium]